MEYLFMVLAFASGTAIGYCLQKQRRSASAGKVTIDLETFEYLKERDDELWEHERAERSTYRFISPRLLERKQVSADFN